MLTSSNSGNNLILHIGPNSKFTQQHFCRIKNLVDGNHLLFYSSTPATDSVEDSETEHPFNYIFDNPKFFRESLGTCNIAIIHHPSIEVHSAMLNISKDALAIWVTWGGDIYALTDFSLLREKTLEILHQYSPRNRGNFHSKIKSKILSEKFYFYFKKGQKNLHRFNVICGFPKEIDLLNPESLSPELIRLPPLFPMLAENLGKIDEPFSHGQKVLISNSSAIENNLLDACYSLNTVDNLTAIVNYPDDDWQKFIICELNTRFPSVELIDQYMETDLWRELFNSLDSLYFATLRNLGFVNILMGIQKGLKIYLDVRNPVYDYLRSKGFTIFELDQFDSHHSSGFQLNLEEKIANRAKLHQLVSMDSYAKIENLIRQHLDNFEIGI